MKQGQILKKLTNKSICANQNGQAVVEYVLLLAVIVSMLFAAQGAFKGVNAFISDYVGQYFICLMDHGELPAQGVTNTADLAKHKNQSKCVAKFSIAGGATLVGGGSGSSGSSGGTNNTGRNGKSGKASENATNANSGSGSKSKSSSGRNGGKGSSSDADELGAGGLGGRSSSSYAKGRINRSNTGLGNADGASDAIGSKVKIIDEDQAVESAFGRADGGSANRSQSRPARYKAIVSGQVYDEVTKNTKRESRQPTTKKLSTAAVEEGFRPGPRRNSFVPPERKPTNLSEDKDTEFGFGSLLKWLMIAGMVVAIIVFFGGQVMNYSNSD